MKTAHGGQKGDRNEVFDFGRARRRSGDGRSGQRPEHRVHPADMGWCMVSHHGQQRPDAHRR